MQAAPLVHGGLAVDQLDLKHERDIVLGALRRTGKRATVVTDFCTTRRLRDLLTDGCRILHYSVRVRVRVTVTVTLRVRVRVGVRLRRRLRLRIRLRRRRRLRLRLRVRAS
jgi:hypothetical protein